MMTMTEYWQTAFMTATEEEEGIVLSREAHLFADFEDDLIDLEAWCEEHGVDYYATDDEGVSFITRWCWEMCGE